VNIVDWQHPIKWTRLVKGVKRTENRFIVTCACGNQRPLKRADAQKVEREQPPCYKCTQRQKAKLGYKTTAEKYGKSFALPYVREYQLTHPSVLNLAMMDILDNVLFIPYEREVRCGNGLIDFVLYGTFAIEVNGYWHTFSQERDERRAKFIREQGYELLILEQADIPDAADRVMEFLGESLRVAI